MQSKGVGYALKDFLERARQRIESGKEIPSLRVGETKNY